jgi:DNA repair exonuclease SbcCD nuclease subunit
MSSILFVGDVHLSDTTPRSRKDDYTAAILKKLAQVADISKGYDAVVFVGDIFHKKRPDRNSHALVQNFIDVLKAYPKNSTYSIIGNHDIRGGNLKTLSEQPLGVVFKTGFLKYLDRDMLFSFKDCTVQLSPLQFTYDNETNLEAFNVNRISGADYVVRVSHVAVLPGGLSPNIYHMPHVPLQDIWAANQNWDLMINGHVHKGSEPMEYNGKVFINTGSICRGALTEYALEKVPHVVGVTFGKSGMKFKFHKLKVASAKEVFKVEEKERKKALNKDLESFVKSIQDSSGKVSKAHSLDLSVMLEDFLGGLKVEEVVKNKVREYLSPQ